MFVALIINLYVTYVNAGPPWTMAHAHFLQMGGFKLCTINSDKILLPRMGRYQTKQKGLRVWEGVLMYNSFRILLAEGKIDFPNISEDEINDRSKGDALSKGIALLQIIWFIAQLIARACQHLTITEVELTTAALAGLNSIMYLFWWSKPLNVRCPFTIRTRELERKLVERGRGKCCNKKSEEYSEEQEEKWTFLNNTEGFQLNAHMMTMARHAGSLMMKLAERVLLDLMVWLHWGTLLNMFCSTSTTFCVSASERVDDPDPSNSSSAINQIIQWICATCKHVVITLLHFPYMLMFLPIDRILRPFWTTSLESFKDAKDKTESKPFLQLLFNEDDMRWIMSMIFYGEKAESKPLLYLSATAGAVFGSIHCAAWQSNFPSDVERLLWLTASLTIVGVCISVVVGIPIYGAIRRSRSRAFSARRMDEWKIWKASQRVMETAPAIVYPLSRFSLLILAVMSLRKLPVSALETVAWTKVVPHL